MLIVIPNVLSPGALEDIHDVLNPEDLIDGRTTAGWHAKQVKANRQLSPKAPYGQKIKDIVQTALWSNPLFQCAVQPRAIHTLLFSYYDSGMTYGSHVDNAFMGQGEQRRRADVSFTIFLSHRESYQGGELILEQSDGDRPYKLDAGSAIVYPSSTLHQVAPVQSGIRWASVGWVQSLVRNPAHRELLFDLDTARRSIFQSQGKTLEFDLISKSHANLLREWSD
ncbi:Fe2+-dependent dioxygenase [Lyngbya confervoides]|uniref:Fe2+-dependent dioxygenase n=1 Tax=Lyngbya confervoides BDU141951 TaxID=1574623 RepID=A0ABD4T6H0_9CYAN|nr:Fe2+-dependent dioxygenase [Lyngbya confervoides]MCM1984157.1 Fe2+-dependent dioxygenase [Lyngbya confervoides BDU141951]